MQQHGYKIYPVNPSIPEVLGEKSYATLSDLPIKPDIVNVFRLPKFIPAIVEEMIQLKLPNLWVQQGIINLEAAARAEAAGIHVVMTTASWSSIATRQFVDKPTTGQALQLRRMNILRPISALLLAGALIFHPSANAQLQVVGDGGPGPVKAQHLTAELVSLAPDIAPGGTLQVGLVLTLEEHWHVYWINAGDSGEPPKVTWTLPDGITAGPMKFPIPSRLPLGPLMDFGYEDEVAFPIQLTRSRHPQARPHPPRRHRQLARLPRGLHSRQGPPRPQPDCLSHRYHRHPTRRRARRSPYPHPQTPAI